MSEPTGEEEYSMRSLFLTWTLIIIVIGGLLLALICCAHRYFIHRQKQTVNVMATRTRPVELSRGGRNNEEIRELTSPDTEIH
ncbi:hypothetical protein J6590_065764 [Homalodisca vitripennis]|nr:hypothetical protein J6590_065764 [Homalodisca vitripennis]